MMMNNFDNKNKNNNSNYIDNDVNNSNCHKITKNLLMSRTFDMVFGSD